MSSRLVWRPIAAEDWIVWWKKGPEIPGSCSSSSQRQISSMHQTRFELDHITCCSPKPWQIAFRFGNFGWIHFTSIQIEQFLRFSGNTVVVLGPPSKITSLGPLNPLDPPDNTPLEGRIMTAEMISTDVFFIRSKSQLHLMRRANCCSSLKLMSKILQRRK